MNNDMQQLSHERCENIGVKQLQIAAMDYAGPFIRIVFADKANRDKFLCSSNVRVFFGDQCRAEGTGRGIMTDSLFEDFENDGDDVLMLPIYQYCQVGEKPSNLEVTIEDQRMTFLVNQEVIPVVEMLN